MACESSPAVAAAPAAAAAAAAGGPWSRVECLARHCLGGTGLARPYVVTTDFKATVALAARCPPVHWAPRLLQTNEIMIQLDAALRAMTQRELEELVRVLDTALLADLKAQARPAAAAEAAAEDSDDDEEDLGASASPWRQAACLVRARASASPRTLDSVLVYCTALSAEALMRMAYDVVRRPRGAYDPRFWTGAPTPPLRAWVERVLLELATAPWSPSRVEHLSSVVEMSLVGTTAAVRGAACTTPACTADFWSWMAARLGKRDPLRFMRSTRAAPALLERRPCPHCGEPVGMLDLRVDASLTRLALLAQLGVAKAPLSLLLQMCHMQERLHVLTALVRREAMGAAVAEARRRGGSPPPSPPRAVFEWSMARQRYERTRFTAGDPAGVAPSPRAIRLCPHYGFTVFRADPAESLLTKRPRSEME